MVDGTEIVWMVFDEETGWLMKTRRGEDGVGMESGGGDERRKLVGAGQMTFIIQECKQKARGFCTCHIPHAGKFLQTAFFFYKDAVSNKQWDSIGIETTGVVVRDSGGYECIQDTVYTL
jgi:hypothetical protein